MPLPTSWVPQFGPPLPQHLRPRSIVVASYCHHCVGSFCGASSFLPSSSASELGSVSHSYVSDSFQDAFDGGTLGEAPAV